MYSKDKSDILFSRMVKAGKRLYYVDVKNDRNGEYYLALTESKRVKEGTEEERPVYEKHKIFIYREDFGKFTDAIMSAVEFVQQKRRAEIDDEYDRNYSQPEYYDVEGEHYLDDDNEIKIDF